MRTKGIGPNNLGCSPLKIKSGPEKKGKESNNLSKARINAARELLLADGVNNPNMSDADVKKSAIIKNVWDTAGSKAKQGLRSKENNYGFEGNFKS